MREGRAYSIDSGRRPSGWSQALRWADARPAFAGTVLVAGGLVALPWYRHVWNKGEVSYIAIAERYAGGDLLGAVNSYFAPLLSWLLAPLLVLGAPTVMAAKVLSVAIALGTLLAFRRLCGKLELSGQSRGLLVLVAIPILLAWTLSSFGPDLLQAGILLLYLSVVLDPAYVARTWSGALAGLLGAGLYFSKSFGLPYFLGHFLLVTVVLCLKHRRNPADVRRVGVHAAAGLLVFAVLAGTWGALLANKYGDFTLGVGPGYNHAIVGPDSPGRPIFYFGFVEPPYEATTSVWEEPHYFAERIESWSPFDSLSSLGHQVRLIATNTTRTVSVFEQFSPFALAAMLGAVLLAAGRQSTPARAIPMVGLLGSLGLYAAGYLPVHSEERYLWGGLLLVLAIGGLVVSQLLETTLSNGARGSVLVVVLVASLLTTPISRLISRSGQGAEVNEIASAVRERLRGTDFASLDDWGAADVVAFRVDGRFWGQPPVGASPDEIVEDLRAKQITHLLAWDVPVPDHPALRLVEEVQAGNRELAIFAVDP